MAVRNSQPNLYLSDTPIRVERLKNRTDFLKAKNGARSHERAFVLQLRTRTDHEASSLRIGYTVTKKVGNAVVRNTIKRRLREATKKCLFDEKFQGKDAVIIARREALTFPFDDLVVSLNQAFEKACSSNRQKRKSNQSKRHIANPG